MSLHDKHRQRLDKKVCEYGLEMLEPHEQLEHLLFAVIPRGDTNKIAHRLLEKFVSVGAVINADPKELEKIEGVGPRTAMFLTTLPSLLGIVERSVKVSKPPELFTQNSIIKFVRTYFYGRLNEAVYLFSLNSAYKLIAVSKVSEGIAGAAYVFPAQLMRQAIRDNASAVIVAHNHPGGKVQPSRNDIDLSRKLVDAFKAVDIEFKDSVIVSGDRYFSMRENGYLEPVSKDYKGREK
ncbi:MAG: hypothetical protein IKW62_05020 [Clostridia bacterium]|nr:hypothetical protein [Clostridia bacterium]